MNFDKKGKKGILLVCLGMMLCLVHFTASGQQASSSGGMKEGLIKKMNEVLESSQLNVEKTVEIQKGLNKLSDQDMQDALLLNKLLMLSIKCFDAGSTQIAKELINKNVEIQNLGGKKRSLVNEQQLLCNIYIDENKIDSAKWILRHLEQEWEKISEGAEDPFILNSKAMLAETEGKYLEASQYLVSALEIFERDGNSMYAARASNNLGELYKSLKMYPKALDRLLDSYDYFEKSQNAYHKLDIIVNIAVVYKSMDSLDQAIRWNLMGVELARKLGNKFNLAKIYMNLGNAFKKAGRYEESSRYLDSTSYISNALGLAYGVFLYHLNKSDLFIEWNKPTDAMQELEKAERMLPDFSTPAVQAVFYENSSKVLDKLGRYEEAFRFLKQSKAITDSLETESALHFLSEWESLIERERSSRKIADLNVKVAKAKFTNLFLLGLAAAGLTVLFFWLRIRARETRMRNQMEEEEKKRLSMEVELRNRELASKAVFHASMSEVVTDMSKKMKRLAPRVNKEGAKELETMIRDLDALASGEEWKEFETRFVQVHEDFNDKLLQICPDLSPVELKVCSLLRLNMSSKEIAVLTNRSQATIINTRSQIRKKLRLVSEDNLTSFLLSL